ncbi:MAG: hypothetical protein AAFP19_19915, partial [Bacteroidota bacterium]
SILDPHDCVDWIAGLLNAPQTDKATHWTIEEYRQKTIDNLSFNMPIGSFADRNRSRYVRESLAALKANCQMLGLANYTTPIRLHFLESKEMVAKKISAWADAQQPDIHLVANEESEPPLQRELMQIMAIQQWGLPAKSSAWMKEGLASYAANSSDGYTVDQIYRYMLEHNHLLPMNLLTSDFYNQSAIIGRHQSAYIVQYLLEQYGLAQFEQLWKAGFGQFEAIYSQSFEEVEKALHQAIRAELVQSPEIQWERFIKAGR